MHLIDYWCPQIILIVTSISKGFEVKFIIFLVFFYMNYFLWLMTHIYKTHTVKVIVSLVLLNSLGLVKRGKKVIFKKKI